MTPNINRTYSEPHPQSSSLGGGRSPGWLGVPQHSLIRPVAL